VAPGDAQFRLSPEAKLEWVRAVDRGDTLYLGDGLNDSLAFTAASVTGTPVVDRAALARNADFHFLGRSLSFLPRLLATAERHGRAVRMVFGFAVSYNAVAATLCLAGLMNPLFAAVLMPVSSVVSLGLARWRMGKRTG
jgi:Cu2+-exporting ATPase